MPAQPSAKRPRTSRHYAIIGAGCVVPPGKVIGEGELWVGNPAKFVRHLDDAGRESLRYSAEHYIRLKDRYLSANSA